MDRASIAAPLAGNPLMKKPVVAFALVVATTCAAAFAQDAPLRGMGLLALNSTGDADRGLGTSSNGRKVLVETPDSGGGSVPHNMRGGGDLGPAPARDALAAPARAPDALPPPAVQQGDPSAPAAATPKRPSYRWQSLVPGAIK